MVSWIDPPQHEPIHPIVAVVVAGDTPQRALGRWVVCCAAVAALAWLCWDICITFDEEVDVVWKMPWSHIKCLYFFLRYMGVCLLGSSWSVGTVDTPKLNFTQHDCFIWTAYQVIAALLICIAVEYVLLLRVFALYASHRTIKILLPLLFVAEVGIMIACVVSFLPKLKYEITCATLSTPRGMFIYGATSIVFQVILFILTLCKFVSALKAGWGNTPIMTLLMRDGTWSFFVLMAVISSYGLVVTFADDAFNLLLYNWLISIWSFVGYRNLLNIFQLSKKPPGHSMGNTHHIFSSHVEFELDTRTERQARTNLLY